ncbi:MAG: hypothetical protein HYR60_11705 [Acidobacteria bacterium]|nr:hypothetical protein [Acidobacteriota bacterium]
MDPLLQFLVDCTRKTARAPLRVGILLEGRAAEPWILECGDQAKSMPGIELEYLALPEPPSEPQGPLLSRFISRCRGVHDPFQTRPLDGPALELAAGSSGLLTAASRDKVRSRSYDVLFAPRASSLRAGCEGLARLGVWSLAVDGYRMDRGNYQFFWNTHRESDFLTVSFVAHRIRLEQGDVFLRFVLSTIPGMYYTRNLKMLEGVPVLFCLCLLAAQERDHDALQDLEHPGVEAPLAPPAPRPGDASVLRFFLDKSLRSLRLKLPGQFQDLEWFVAWRFQPSELRDLACFPGREAADPFGMCTNGRSFVFFEDMSPGNLFGRLAALEVHPERGPGGPEVIIERSYHLSYPCVFQHEGASYLIPESAENRTVDLYRADELPFRWTHLATLASGPRFVDTTPFFHNGIWYFFTTAQIPGKGLVNLLFFSDTLTGPWRSHPANPLSADAAASRGAGHIFQRDGAWIRPIQDCAVRYGYAIVLQQILELTPERFREKPVGKVLPDWRPGLLATHTWNAAGPLELRDGRRVRRC